MNEIFDSSTRKGPSPIYSLSEAEHVAIANRVASENERVIPQTLKSSPQAEDPSLWNQRVGSRAEIEPKCSPSKSSIQASTSGSCSPTTTSSLSLHLQDIANGLQSMDSYSPLESRSQPSGCRDEDPTSSLGRQVGGTHYKDFAIQPIEFIHANGIGFAAGNVIKYVCRYTAKDGLRDLEKAKHYIELLIDMEGASHERS